MTVRKVSLKGTSGMRVVKEAEDSPWQNDEKVI
jgi:hypothetical protein